MLIQQIIDAWHDDQEHPNRGRTKRMLPALEVVSDFVETAYLASCKQEEGRSFEFSAVLVCKTDLESLYRSDVLIFETPVPFNESTIQKVAPAFDPELSSLAVEPNAEGKLEVWGAFSFSPPHHRYNEGPGNSGPDFLTVETVAPGSLAFSRGYAALGRIAGREFLPSSPTLFTPNSLGKYWWEFLTRTPLWTVGRGYYHYALDALQVLLNEISRRGHGGTLVVLDVSTNEGVTKLFRSNYVFEQQQDVNELLLRCLPPHDPDRGESIFVGFRKDMLEALRRMAQLAAIDGALIIDSSFKIIAFGAKLDAEIWNKKPVEGPDGWGNPKGQPFDISHLGTRHQSACNFAAACQAAIVFVISQDGPVRAFHRIDHETVLIWPDCSSSMFSR